MGFDPKGVGTLTLKITNSREKLEKQFTASISTLEVNRVDLNLEVRVRVLLFRGVLCLCVSPSLSGF